MYVRLAFSVAAHLEPEILLVDEVLAVGDAAFQKKCLDKMGNVASQGRTVLFVSHNMVAVQNLCGRAILLDEGKILEEGDTARVVSNYLARSYSPLTEQIWPDVHIAPGNEQVRLRRLCIRPEHGLSGDPISHETSFVVEVEYWNLVPGAVIYPCLHFYTEQQIIAFTSAPIDYDLSEEKPKPKGLYKSICHVPDNFLNSGAHRVLLLMIRDTSRILYKFENALSFEILDLGTRPGSWYGKEPGIVRPKMQWETNSPQ
jgi:lipopolysaccharide transport system ATP-binding protein